MSPAVTGKTKVLGIIGFPVSHSLSPVMHNAACAALGLDYVYVPFPTAVEDLPAVLAGFKASGVAGFNATIPHKVALIPLLDEISPEARLVGAVNTVVIREGRAFGYNTDGIGLLTALSLDLGFQPPGKSVLVLGAGGAARSAVFALADAGCARVTVVNRSPQRGVELSGAFASHFPEVQIEAAPPEQLADPAFMGAFDLLVNTSSVGMRDDFFPGLHLDLMRKDAVVYDMVYAPPVTPLLRKAGELGMQGANGLGMLVAQGESAFAFFTGATPPAGLMRASLTAVLEGKS
ncbi:shikimate dehydrogenase [Geomesophilobacter sediminis]|uniref:Shikimate dehydrogenase (NADP(+)) n=1 Tax=Geomesophilobacter sediminis TaxID=2798584 RepID=A0A8J7J0U6_9BACT|nr:shikimate dehydrogenase [Geomesophilobacter sediminis]MBJ6724093.1 shikimate dehydrogenase [Geomesophilobacter sediminis]